MSKINFPLGYPYGEDNPTPCFGCKYYMGIANEKMCALEICDKMPYNGSIPKKDFGVVLKNNETANFVKGKLYRFAIREDVVFVENDKRLIAYPLADFKEDFITREGVS